MIWMFIDCCMNKDYLEWLVVLDLWVMIVNKNKDLFKEMDSILWVKKKMMSVMILRYWIIIVILVY